MINVSDTEVLKHNQSNCIENLVLQHQWWWSGYLVMMRDYWTLKQFPYDVITHSKWPACLHLEENGLVVRTVDLRIRTHGFKSLTRRCVCLCLWAKQLSSTWLQQRTTSADSFATAFSHFFLLHLALQPRWTGIPSKWEICMPMKSGNWPLWARHGLRRNKQEQKKKEMASTQVKIKVLITII